MMKSAKVVVAFFWCCCCSSFSPSSPWHLSAVTGWSFPRTVASPLSPAATRSIQRTSLAAGLGGGSTIPTASSSPPSTVDGNTTATNSSSSSNTTESSSVGTSSSSLSKSVTQIRQTLGVATTRISTSVVSSVRSGVSTTQKVVTSIETQVVTAVLLGTLSTFLLNNYPITKVLDQGPIVASGLVGLLSSALLFNNNLPLSIATFCGSFAGMAKLAVIPTVWPDAVVLGLVCASLLRLFDHQKWLVGKGGRLGFIAQVACTLHFIVSSRILRPATTSVESPASLVAYGKLQLAMPTIRKLLSELAVSIIFTVAGALLMTIWKEYMMQIGGENKNAERDSGSGGSSPNPKIKTLCRRLSSSVAASSVTGLLSAVALPSTMAGPIYCGSFVAMSSPEQLKTYGSMIASSALAGIWQIAMSGVLLGGWGGKLGTAALLGVASYKGLQSAGTYIQSQRSSATEDVSEVPISSSSTSAALDLAARK